MSKHIKLWNTPYNGGWIWFDRKQMKRFSGGYGIKDTDHVGGEYIEPTLWWCIGGFCGRFLICEWPWGGPILKPKK